MSWKFVFNPNTKAGTGFDKIFDLACVSTYKFFLFNGDVYFIDDGKAFLTGISVDDLF